MRRLIATTLFLLFSLPLISPLLAFAAGPESSLPACCRRNGVHHCTSMQSMDSMGSSTSSDPGTRLATVQQKCPAFPAVVTPLQHGNLALHIPSEVSAEFASRTTVKFQTAARTSLTLDRSHQKRGPPVELL